MQASVHQRTRMALRFIAAEQCRRGWRLSRCALLLCMMLGTPLHSPAASVRHPRPPAMCAPPEPAACNVRLVNGRWWYITPSGRLFFSVGVCCVDPGEDWATYRPDKPAYAAWQEYADGAAWAAASLGRLKAWRFTTVGGWSDNAVLNPSPEMSLCTTHVLHMGAAAGAPWLDMWSSKIISTMDQTARQGIAAAETEKRLLGFYSDNELGWWNGALWKLTLNSQASSGQRQRLVAMLRSDYHGGWAVLLKDFEPAGCSSFNTLASRGMLYLRPGSDGTREVSRFLTLVATRYYQLCSRIIHKYAPHALYLGDRYQSFYYPEVAAAAKPYVDVLSTNLNPTWTDGTFPRFYLPTLHALGRRPVAVTEFYMTARQNRSGNPNNSSNFPVVETQAERARAFATTLEMLARTPYVVGADWFQYADEPTYGRGDGENYNMGLVDIHDRPYRQLIHAAASIDADADHRSGPEAMSSALSGMPTAPQEPYPPSPSDRPLQAWDRNRGFVPASSTNPTADLYACWKSGALYLGLWSMDMLEGDLYPNGKLPEPDRELLTLDLPAEQVRIRLGGQAPPRVSGPGVEVHDLTRQSGYVGVVAIVRIPASLLKVHALQPGQSVPLHADLQSYARRRREVWQTVLRVAAR